MPKRHNDDAMNLLLGTTNVKKRIELASLLAPYGFQIETLADVSDPLEIVEDGDSFRANADLKAQGQASHLRRWVLAEDSGLEVEALDGRPGIYSARFAGESATDEENNDLLLQELGDLSLERRSARYVCEIVVCDPMGEVRARSRGSCRGRIRRERFPGRTP